MQEVLLTVSVIRSARTVGGGAGSLVAPQCLRRALRMFPASPGWAASRSCGAGAGPLAVAKAPKARWSRCDAIGTRALPKREPLSLNLRMD